MDIVKILLKKEFGERISNLKNKKKDIAGIIFNAVLILLVVSVFAFVFVYLTKTYAVVKIGYVTRTKDRIFEIFTIFFSVLLALLVFMGTAKLNKNLIGSGSLSLLHLPISPFQIFLSKLLLVYIELSLTSIIVTLPVAFVFAVQGYIVWWAILVSIPLAVFLPIVALGISSLLTIPYYFIKKWLNKQFIIQLVIYIAIMIVAFLIYSVFLKVVKALLESGQIAFMFNEDFVNNLGDFSRHIYPINFFSKIMVGDSVFLNLFWIIIISVACGVLCFFLSKLIFQLVRQNKLAVRDEFTKIRAPRKQKPVIVSLMGKEFTMVLRTPSYAFNYYAIVLSLPLMVVITTNLLISMMKNLTIFKCNFEIVLSVVCMYSILLNSFCATNMSRDGKFYNSMKTYPILPKQIVWSKILFCSITSGIAILATGFVIAFISQLSVLKTLAVVLIAMILNFGVICMATRKDLNTMQNSGGGENSSSSNFLVFWGLLFSVGVVAISLVMSVALQIKYSVRFANIATCAVVFGIGIIVCVASILYLFRKLDKKFKETTLWNIKF